MSFIKFLKRDPLQHAGCRSSDVYNKDAENAFAALYSIYLLTSLHSNRIHNGNHYEYYDEVMNKDLN